MKAECSLQLYSELFNEKTPNTVQSHYIGWKNPWVLCSVQSYNKVQE